MKSIHVCILNEANTYSTLKNNIMILFIERKQDDR